MLDERYDKQLELDKQVKDYLKLMEGRKSMVHIVHNRRHNLIAKSPSRKIRLLIKEINWND